MGEISVTLDTLVAGALAATATAVATGFAQIHTSSGQTQGRHAVFVEPEEVANLVQ